MRQEGEGDEEFGKTPEYTVPEFVPFQWKHTVGFLSGLLTLTLLTPATVGPAYRCYQGNTSWPNSSPPRIFPIDLTGRL